LDRLSKLETVGRLHIAQDPDHAVHGEARSRRASVTRPSSRQNVPTERAVEEIAMAQTPRRVKSLGTTIGAMRTTSANTAYLTTLAGAISCAANLKVSATSLAEI
jgi:hypothetical protein